MMILEVHHSRDVFLDPDNLMNLDSLFFNSSLLHMTTQQLMSGLLES